MSTTPRTDAFYANPPENEEAYQFACQLEHKLAETEQQLHALRLVCGTTDADKFQTSYDRVVAQAEILREALSFYAEKKHFAKRHDPFLDDANHSFCPAGAIVEHGQKARCALSVTPELASQELATLKAWKAEALSVLNQIDFQAIAKALGLMPGVSISSHILPGILALKRDRDRYLEKFTHIFGTGPVHDQCAKCGLDLRDPIHIRSHAPAP